jgi:hypothetical protein
MFLKDAGVSHLCHGLRRSVFLQVWVDTGKEHPVQAAIRWHLGNHP